MKFGELFARPRNWLLAGLPAMMFCLSFIQAADADECGGWVGLWRVEPANETEGQAIHLSISSKDGQCRALYFRNDFGRVEQALGLQIEGEQLALSSLPVSKAFRLELTRQGDSASGTMDLVHPQFKVSYHRQAHRVTTQNAWDPIEEIQKKAGDLGLVDLSGLLLEKAPTGSLPEFEKFWVGEIEPSFYAIVHDVVYGPAGGVEERRKNLEEIVGLLRDPDYAARARKLQEEQVRVVGRIKESVSNLFFPNLFVSMPSLGEFEVDQIPFAESFLVRLSSDSKRVPLDRLGAWLAREHLQLATYALFAPADRSLVARIVREGLSTQWTVANGFAQHPFECQADPPEGFAELSLEPSAEAKQKVVEAIRYPPLASQVSKKDVVLIGYDFATQLTAAFSVEEILTLNRGSLSERLWEYLGAEP